LNATAVFHYADSELNSLLESELLIYTSTNTGANWIQVGGTVNTTNNTVTVSGINSFSLWTLAASSIPLSVKVASFTATSKQNSIELKWSTATEKNNFGFELQRFAIDQQLKPESKNWNKIAFIEGNGTTNASKEYSFFDKNLFPGKYSYRLKQIDRDGTFEYSQSVEVTIGQAPKEFALEQNYPNPFNPTTVISYRLPASNHVILKVYDAIGKEVATLVNEVKEAGYYSATFDASKLSSGIYFVRLHSDDKVQMKKMVLMK
jgi:hypothetical protein